MKRRIAFATVRFRIETRTSSVISSTKIVAPPPGSVFLGRRRAVPVELLAKHLRGLRGYLHSCILSGPEPRPIHAVIAGPGHASVSRREQLLYSVKGHHHPNPEPFEQLSHSAAHGRR